jgi:two-component system sensor kinase FixL
MGNAAVKAINIVGGSTPEQSSAARRAFVRSGLILLAAVGLSALIYCFDRLPLRPQRTQMDVVALEVAAILVCGGAASLVFLRMGMAAWARHVRQQAREQEAREWHSANAALRVQLAEAAQVGERAQARRFELEEQANKAQERANSLATTNAVLQDELNRRNRSERALSRQRQELESSKSVLELHVQARTQELQLLQSRYEFILNSAGDGICGLDLDGRATFVNPAVARITGWQIEELIGKTANELFHTNGHNGKNGEAGQNLTEQVFHRKDGSEFPVELVKTPLNENGRVIGSVLVFKDITERKRAEESLARKAAELSRSNAELEQFAFVASHDLQEPLRKIQAFGDRLKVKAGASASPEVRDYLERMQSAAARMQTLINDLLAFSRVISSSQPFVPVELAKVTREVLGDLEVRIEQSHAQIEMGELPTIDGDPMQMRQLLLNLIGNALKFQPPGAKPVVKISARLFNSQTTKDTAFLKRLTANGHKPAPTGDLCEISVQDNGIGFEEKYLDKIFAVFQRLHGRTEYEGTGVGLAVCRRIVDRHGGNITATSQLDQGATFIVTLPVRHSNGEASS